MESIKDSKEYGEHYQSHTLEMYKLHAEMADRVSHRRGVMNSLYATANIALIALLAKLYGDANSEANVMLLVTLSLAGVFISFVWHQSIVSYKQLNAAKFQALDELEKALPLPFYKIEYEAYKREKRKDFSDIEKTIPIIVGLVYLVSLIFSIFY